VSRFRLIGITGIIGKSGAIFYSEFISESPEILKQVQDEMSTPALSRNCEFGQQAIVIGKTNDK
jgi:hypothetical protein